jgi:hypothetical protein
VWAFVETNRGETGLDPGFLDVECERAGIERLAAALVREDESSAAGALVEAVIEEFAAQGRGDRDAPVA